MDTLDPELVTLVTLARGARGRISADEGAAIRDDLGRTYASASVTLPHLTLTALQGAVAQAAASGSRVIASAVLVSRQADLRDVDRAVIRDLGGTGALVLVVAPDGTVMAQSTA